MTRVFRLALLALFAGLTIVATPAGAAPESPSATSTEDEAASLDSPRASLLRFLTLARDADFESAAAYLEVPPARTAEAAELARRLKFVIDRHVWFDLETVSARPGGNPDDGLPWGHDQLAELPSPDGGLDPLRLVRRGPEGARWIFPKSVVQRIDAWYEHLDNRWLLEHLPIALLRPGPQDLMWWQWIALPILILLAILASRLVSRVTLALASRAAAMTRTEWDDAVLARIGGPFTLALTLGTTWLVLPWLALYAPAEAFVHRGLRGGLFVVFFWTLQRMIDVVRQVIAGSPWGREHPASRSLLPLGARVGKVVLFAIAIVALLSEMGYPVTSLVAGLGIGGLAIALAAQKTVENLFGAFSIGADQPFREGDLVRIEDFIATVEFIGLRSTRFRTADRTLISIPNGKLAEMRLESLAARDRLRLSCVLGLVYDTRADQVRQVLAGFEAVLTSHPHVWPEGIAVKLRSLGVSSLDIEITAWFQTNDYAIFQSWREEVLLSFMEVVEKSGTSFAFPTQTIHFAKSAPVALAAMTAKTEEPPVAR
ncbi:MAG: mechanosensitive ion channel family protein [Myxococcales bacterium]|nr:mechanosensitive ion channel family protein [Myxococcales bacterium]